MTVKESSLAVSVLVCLALSFACLQALKQSVSNNRADKKTLHIGGVFGINLPLLREKNKSRECV